MQIILVEDVQNLGNMGETVKVKPGYARNYLLPRGLAAPATRGNVAQVEHEKKAAIARAAKAKGESEGVAKSLSAVVIELTMQAGEGDKLFGSVGTKDIAEALKAKGHEVDRKKIQLGEPIKFAGEHAVVIKLGYDVAANIKVIVAKSA